MSLVDVVANDDEEENDDGYQLFFFQYYCINIIVGLIIMNTGLILSLEVQASPKNNL